MAAAVLTAYARKVLARDEEAAQASVTVSAPTMALIRLRGVLDAGQRAGLAAGDLLVLADRIVSGHATEADAALLAALDVDDLASVGMTAGTFIVSFVAAFRSVEAFVRPLHPDACATTFARATASMHGAAGMLRERLQVLPDADELQRVGDLFKRGTVKLADLAVVRALPGPYLRAQATAGHWRVFVDYRLHD